METGALWFLRFLKCKTPVKWTNLVKLKIVYFQEWRAVGSLSAAILDFAVAPPSAAAEVPGRSGWSRREAGFAPASLASADQVLPGA